MLEKLGEFFGGEDEKKDQGEEQGEQKDKEGENGGYAPKSEPREYTGDKVLETDPNTGEVRESKGTYNPGE